MLNKIIGIMMILLIFLLFFMFKNFYLKNKDLKVKNKVEKFNICNIK
jgi:hypothetical protein